MRGVVPLDAPRYSILESFLNGNSFPPTVRYAESLLLLGSHSLYSVPCRVNSLSPYTLFPGQDDIVYSLPLSWNTVPEVKFRGSMGLP